MSRERVSCQVPARLPELPLHRSSRRVGIHPFFSNSSGVQLRPIIAVAAMERKRLFFTKEVGK